MPRIHKARRAPTLVADLWATRRVCFQTHQRRASQREASPAAKGRDETVASQTRPSTIHYPREANGFPYRALGWWNGRHVRLRGVCRKACGFKSRPEHQIARSICSFGSQLFDLASIAYRFRSLSQEITSHRGEERFAS